MWWEGRAGRDLLDRCRQFPHGHRPHHVISLINSMIKEVERFQARPILIGGFFQNVSAQRGRNLCLTSNLHFFETKLYHVYSCVVRVPSSKSTFFPQRNTSPALKKKCNIIISLVFLPSLNQSSFGLNRASFVLKVSVFYKPESYKDNGEYFLFGSCHMLPVFENQMMCKGKCKSLLQSLLVLCLGFYCYK